MSRKSRNISDYWRVSNAAAELGIARTTLATAVQSGSCDSETLADGTPVVTLDQVEAWLATDRRPGRPAKVIAD